MNNKSVFVTNVFVPSELLEKLRKFHGLHPYNTQSNYAIGDPYFAMSIERDFTAEQIKEAKKKLGI